MSSIIPAQAFDPKRFKEQERAGYNLIAARYEAASGAREPVKARLLDLAALRPGLAVLDVASGPGMLAREAARRVAHGGTVVAADIAETALDEGRRRAVEEGVSNIRFQVEDAEALSFAADQFDRVVSGFGFMHFPVAADAAREMFRVLRFGGRLAAAVWGAEERVPFLSCALNCLQRNLPPPKVARPSIFRFGTPGAFASLLADAGFGSIRIESMAITAAFADAAEYWSTFLALAGVTTVALAKLPQDVQAHLARDVAQDLESYRSAAGYTLSGEVLIATATAAK
jgi:ubiquinone/menaquinone biosynthesis C-methylase UbiE